MGQDMIGCNVVEHGGMFWVGWDGIECGVGSDIYIESKRGRVRTTTTARGTHHRNGGSNPNLNPLDDRPGGRLAFFLQTLWWDGKDVAQPQPQAHHTFRYQV